MSSKFYFEEGEKLLCYHGPLIYEAKCLRKKIENGQVRYLIHYVGWNKKWDEFVSVSRMLKYNEMNLEKQEEVKLLHAARMEKIKNNKKRQAKKIDVPGPSKKQVQKTNDKSMEHQIKKIDVPVPSKKQVYKTNKKAKERQLKKKATKPARSKRQAFKPKVRSSDSS